MLSSRFLVVSLLYISYATGLVAADSRNPFGGNNQLCQSVQTVTVTVTPGQPSRSANNPNASPPPVVTSQPGKVNLATSSSVVKNTKTSTSPVHTSTNVKNDNTKINTSTKNGNGNTKTNVNSSTVKSNPTDTKVNGSKGSKTSSVLTSSTGLPPVSTGRVLAAPSSSSVPPPAQTGSGNPSTGLTLNPSVIQNVNGKGQAAGEADSLVSTNNFIAFCVGKTLTNGKQVKTGSCDPVPMGDIPATDKMPSAKFNSPKNFDTIAANTPFTISLQIQNLVTGTFTNAANTYYAAPQQLVGGVIKGHSHVTVQQMTSLNSPAPLDPKVFAFFKGLNDAAKNGVLTADVTNGLPAGVYRISSINSAGNHQEALGPVAQRGSFNDVVYITVTDGGNSSSVDVSSSGVVSSTVSGVSSTSPAVSPPTGNGGGQNASSTALPVPTGNGSEFSPSAQPPVSTNGGGNNYKGGKNDVVSTSTAPPKASTPPVGKGNTDTKNPTVSSSTVLPTKGGSGRRDYEGGRMHKRSRLA